MSISAKIDSICEKPTLKQLQNKKYPFSDSDLSAILDDLLKKKIILLPESKRQEESGKVNNPKYCRYHQLVGHKLENCITLKELIMKLVNNGRILLHNDETVQENHASITTFSNPLHKSHKELGHVIQFGSLPPVQVLYDKPPTFRKPTVSSKHTLSQSKKEGDEDEGWIKVARKRPGKQVRVPHQGFVHHERNWGRKRLHHLRKSKKPNIDVKPPVQAINPPNHDPPSLQENAEKLNEETYSFAKIDSLQVGRDSYEL